MMRETLSKETGTPNICIKKSAPSSTRRSLNKRWRKGSQRGGAARRNDFMYNITQYKHQYSRLFIFLYIDILVLIYYFLLFRLGFFSQLSLLPLFDLSWPQLFVVLDSVFVFRGEIFFRKFIHFFVLILVIPWLLIDHVHILLNLNVLYINFYPLSHLESNFFFTILGQLKEWKVFLLDL